MHKIVRSWAPVAVWCALIFCVSSIPNLKTELGVWDLILRKLAHMVEYGVLFILTRRAIVKSTRSFIPRSASAGALIFSVVYAMSDEFHQSFVPMRGPSVVDVGIDAIGAFAGLACYQLYRRLRYKERFELI